MRGVHTWKKWVIGDRSVRSGWSHPHLLYFTWGQVVEVSVDLASHRTGIRVEVVLESTAGTLSSFVAARLPISKGDAPERLASRLVQKRSTRAGSNCVPAHLRSSFSACIGVRGA